jgi:hypothetical protein
MWRPSLSFAAPVLWTGCLLLGLGCTSSSGDQHTLGPIPPTSTTGTVHLCFTGNSSEDWQHLAFKLLDLTLTPQDGSAPVTLLKAPEAGLPFNLVQLDHAGQFFGSFQVPAGSYRAATLTLSSSSRDMFISASGCPSPGFQGTGDSSLKDSALFFANGGSGNGTVPVSIPFGTPLQVASDRPVVLDLDWDSQKPSFLIPSIGSTGTASLWTLNFDQVVRQVPVADPAQIPLAPLYGAVLNLGPDPLSFQVSETFAGGLLDPSPVTLPYAITVHLDPVNGTQFLDVGQGTLQRIRDLSGIGNALPGRRVRVAGRLAGDGTLTASRIWVGDGLIRGNELGGRISCLGYVVDHLDVGLDGTNATQDGFEVTTAPGGDRVTDATLITLADPLDPAGTENVVGSTVDWISNGNLARGFLVEAVMTGYDVPRSYHFQDLAILSANYTGDLVQVDATGLTCAWPPYNSPEPVRTRLPFVDAASSNGNDDQDVPVTGFAWRPFWAPSHLTHGDQAIASFTAATAGQVTFGGSVGTLACRATIHGTWNASLSGGGGWQAQYAILQPLQLPLATVATAWTPGSEGGSFTITVPGGDTSVTVDVASGGDTPTRVYQVFMSAPGSPAQTSARLVALDPSSASGKASLAALIALGAPIQVYGIPEANGNLLAGEILCYTYTL